jgi:dipeptidyl aminopeptidase/acylaminoacyl peptidase
MNKTLFASVLMLLTSLPALAQGSVDDYKRAYGIRNKYSGKMTHGDVQAHRLGDEHSFWYSVWNGDSTQYKQVNAETGEVTLLPGNPERDGQNRRQWGRQAGEREEGAEKSVPVRVNHEVTRHSRQRHWMETGDEKSGWQTSPDKKFSIFHKQNNLWVMNNPEPRPADAASADEPRIDQRPIDSERPLTTDGTDSCYYSGWGSFSDDGKYFATTKIVPAPKHYVYYVEAVPSGDIEKQGRSNHPNVSRSVGELTQWETGGGVRGVQPVLHKQEYRKPGDTLDFRIPVIVEVATGRVIEPSTELFESQYEVSRPEWNKDMKSVRFEFNERGHHTYRLLELSAETGRVRCILEEKNDKYINYGRIFRHHFDDGRRMLWTSERDGWNHIYLYDKEKAKLVRQITKGQYYVRDVVRVDEEKGVIYFTANGPTGLRQNEQEDPYLIHYYKVGLNGKGLTCLTPEEGNHRATFTSDMAYLIDTYSTVTTPPVSVLRSANDGHVIKVLEQANIDRLVAQGWKAPEVFVAKGRDGVTDIWGLIQRPSNFDPSKRYPVIEYIYSGPGDQYVPKSFTPWLYNLADLAELGFIVVQMDGMTTSFRSRAFEEVCYKNLKDSGFPDRMLWIKAAGAKYPYMDIDRVGIYGCSAGGQEALAAVLFHGDFYKAAYSACGCHDNRMDKIWWNEQWMSYPIDSSYVECSNVENAYRLERPLMLVVGEQDDNVDPASTMQVADALIKAGKDFELVVIPGAHHTMGESYGEHKRYDFFVKNLLGVNPPKWSELR